MQLLSTSGKFHHHYCLCGQPETMNHIVKSCPLTRLADDGFHNYILLIISQSHQFAKRQDDNITGHTASSLTDILLSCH